MHGSATGGPDCFTTNQLEPCPACIATRKPDFSMNGYLFLWAVAGVLGFFVGFGVISFVQWVT